MESYVNPRRYEEINYSIASGAVSISKTISKAFSLVSLQLNFSDTPDSESVVIQLKNSEGDIVRAHAFDPSEDAINNVTRVFDLWRTDRDGGNIILTYTNTSDHLTDVFFGIEYNND